MRIKVVNYAPSASPMVLAFVDIELDGWLRFNGLNLDRDGGLRSAQLTATRAGQRSYLLHSDRSVTVLDTGSLKIPVLMLWPLYSMRRGRATFSEISFNGASDPGESIVCLSRLDAISPEKMQVAPGCFSALGNTVARGLL